MPTTSQKEGPRVSNLRVQQDGWHIACSSVRAGIIAADLWSPA